MASVYRRNSKSTYTIAYRDADGRRRQKSAKTTDRRLAERIAADLENRTALRREGLIDVTADRHAEAGRKPIGEHLSDFIAGLRSKGVSGKQAGLVESRARRVLALCNVESIADLIPSKVQTAIGSIRDSGASAQTVNHYLRATKQFTRWLTVDGRTAVDPIQHLRTGNVDADRRHVRRTLSEDETGWLTRTAETGPVILGMSGQVRMMLYCTALGTGFRASELGSLTPESFDLDGNPPTVTVKAGYSKRRREDIQPIRNDLAGLLRPWLADKPEGVPVFAMPDKPVMLIRRDLEAARSAWLERDGGDSTSDFLCYVDHAGGVSDFHSLRHTYISRLVSGGCSVKVAQELARHSTPSLTIGIYAHARLHDLTGALDSLPSTNNNTENESVRLRKTGTNDTDCHVQRICERAERNSQGEGVRACESETGTQHNTDEAQVFGTARVSATIRHGARGDDKATERIRTVDLRFTKPLLCQLSYGGNP